MANEKSVHLCYPNSAWLYAFYYLQKKKFLLYALQDLGENLMLNVFSVCLQCRVRYTCWPLTPRRPPLSPWRGRTVKKRVSRRRANDWKPRTKNRKSPLTRTGPPWTQTPPTSTATTTSHPLNATTTTTFPPSVFLFFLFLFLSSRFLFHPAHGAKTEGFQAGQPLLTFSSEAKINSNVKKRKPNA